MDRWQELKDTTVKPGLFSPLIISVHLYCEFGLTHSGFCFHFSECKDLHVAQSGCFTVQSQSNQLGKKSYYRIQVWYNQFNKSYFLIIRFHPKYFVVNTSADHITTTNTQNTRWITGLIELIYLHSSSQAVVFYTCILLFYWSWEDELKPWTISIQRKINSCETKDKTT